MDRLRRPDPKQLPITITQQFHIQQTDYLSMNLKKMNGVPVPAPRRVFRPVPAPRLIRGKELSKLVFSDAPSEVEVGGNERPLGPNAPRVPAHAGSSQLEAAEGHSGDPSSNPNPVSQDNRRRQRRRRKKKDKIRMIVADGRRVYDMEFSSSEEETSQEKVTPARKSYDIHIVKSMSEIVQISGRLKVDRFPLSVIKEDQDQEDESDNQDSDTGDDSKPKAKLKVRIDNAKAEIDRGNAEEAKLLDDVEEEVEDVKGKAQGEEKTEDEDDPEEDDEPDWGDQEEENEENNNEEEEDNEDEYEQDEEKEEENNNKDEEDEDEGEKDDENDSDVGTQRWVTDESRPYEYEKGQENDDEEIGGGEDEDEDDEYEVDEEYEDEEQSGNDSVCDVYDSNDYDDDVYDNDDY